jgi:hypothetical protein
MRKRLLGLVLIAGCTTTQAASGGRATIVRSGDEVRVCRDGGGWSVGQPLRFVRPVCKPLNAKSAVVHCAAEPLTDGAVARVDDDRCATVVLHGGAPPEPGDGVEAAAVR